MSAAVLYPQGFKQTRIDANAVDRIVAAVEQSGRQQARAPTDLDRKRLADDLSGAWIYFEQGKFGDPASKDRRSAKKRLNDIINAAAKLDQLLEPPKDDTAEDHVVRIALSSCAYCGDTPQKPRHLFQFRESLREIGEVADYVLEMLAGKPAFRTLSPLQDFLGDWLPDIYFNHFKKRPGVSRTSIEDPTEGRVRQKVGGPYIRFAIAVGREFGEDFSEQTIIDYLKHWKTSKKK